MKISLRRLARRAKATSSDPMGRGGAQRCGEARRRRFAAAAGDVEAPGKPVRRLCNEAQHGAWWWGEEGGDSSPLTEHEAFLEFYQEKLYELKEKEGGVAHLPISGNLYMYKALASFAHSTKLFLSEESLFVDCGLILIMLVQILAPLSMLISAVQHIEFGHTWGNSTHYFGVREFGEYHYGSDDKGLSHIFMRILGLVFLLLFLMNGLYVLENDRVETKKVTEMAFLFREVRDKITVMTKGDPPEEVHPPRPKTRWLWIGAILNCACLLLCSFAMCFVFIIEDGVKDLVLDAFGLAFIYNLDDIGGDLAFLDEKWDEDYLGDVYGCMAEDDRTKEKLNEMTKKRESSLTPDTVYYVCRIFVMFLHVALPLVYVFLEMKPKDDD